MLKYFLVLFLALGLIGCEPIPAPKYSQGDILHTVLSNKKVMVMIVDPGVVYISCSRATLYQVRGEDNEINQYCEYELER